MALDPCARCRQPARWPRFPKIRGVTLWRSSSRAPKLIGPLCSLCAAKPQAPGEVLLEVEFTSFPERDRIAPKS